MGDLRSWDNELEVGLLLAQTCLGPGDQLLYNVVNRGGVTIGTGLGYSLDYRKDGHWNELSLGLRFRAVGFAVRPDHGRELTARVPVDAVPGVYRLRKTLKLTPPPSAELSRLPASGPPVAAGVGG